MRALFHRALLCLPSWGGCLLLTLWAGQPAASALPADVLAALQRAQVPASSVAVVVAPAVPGAPAWVAHRAAEPINPASAMKLVTTFAALDLLGPAHGWRTTVHTGGAVQNRIKETVVLEEKARQDLAAARRGVTLGTRSAFLGVQSGLGQVKALEAAEASTKLALEATELGYKVGVRVNLDVLNAQSQLFDTRRDLSKARYDVIVNSLKLRQASGPLQPQDVRNIDALLAP